MARKASRVYLDVVEDDKRAGAESYVRRRADEGESERASGRTDPFTPETVL